MLTFIVPALNEEENIAATLDTIRATAQKLGVDPIQIIVVNDGSSDSTGEIVERLRAEDPRIELITHPRNRGMAACFRSGLERVNHERWMFVPGDNDMSVDFLSGMLKYRDAAELVLAYPVNSENRTLGRNVLSLLFRLAYLIAFRATVHYINGPAIYTTTTVRGLQTRGSGFSIVSELNTKLLRSGVTFCEIPGFFQTGSRPRGTVSLRNLAAVCRSYLQLIWDIHVANRAQYSATPRRVFLDVLAP